MMECVIEYSVLLRRDGTTYSCASVYAIQHYKAKNGGHDTRRLSRLSLQRIYPVGENANANAVVAKNARKDIIGTPEWQRYYEQHTEDETIKRLNQLLQEGYVFESIK
jgi:hypothetical protein